MISRLLVRNWKAYAALEVTFGPGATFIVAHNGIGKTSLMEALHFSLFGSRGLGVSLTEARRFGTAETYVEVDVALKDGRLLHIERQISGSFARPKVSAHGLLDQVELDEAGVDEAIASEFQADIVQLPMLVMVPDRALDRQINDANNVSVVGHLSRMLGVDRLRDSAADLSRLSQQETKNGDSIRIAESDDSAIQRLDEERSDLEKRRNTLREHYSQLRQSLQSLRESLAAANSWSDYRNAIDSREREVEGRLEEFFSLAAQAIGRPNGLFSERQDRGVVLREVREIERQAADVLAASRSGIQQVERSIGLLRQAGPICPTCRRPLSPEDARTAQGDLESELRALQVRAVGEAERVEALRRALNSIEDEERAIAGLPYPVRPSSTEPSVPTGEVSSQLARVEQEAEETQRTGSETTARIDAIDHELNTLRQSAALKQRAMSKYRLAELASIASTTMNRLADSLVSEHIDPLARQLAKRWDELWQGTPGLELTEAGELQLRRGDHIVSFSNFSGGEKTLAVVLLRLLAVQMTTRAGFICFDEPLEHLDVKNRRMLARLLVEASSGAGAMRQVIVTTYEESIARALGARSRDKNRARVEYVTAEHE